MVSSICRLLEAVECYEKHCVELIDETCNEGLEEVLDYKLEFFDYQHLADLRATLIHQTIDKCSFEEIKAYLLDVNLLRTVHYYEKAISMEYSSPPACNTSIATLYVRIDGMYWMHLLIRYYESLTESLALFRDIHCEKDDPRVLWEQTYRDIHSGNYTGDPLPLQDAINEIRTFLNLDIPVEKYGEKAVIQLASLLYNMGSMSSNSYTEDWWVGTLRSCYSLYKILQRHHHKRVQCFVYLQGPLIEDFQKQIETRKWKAFMYAEAERAQVMLYQQLVASKKLNSSQQWGHNVHSVEDIRRLCADVRKGPSVYVQYSSLDPNHKLFYIYVIDQVDHCNSAPSKIV